MGVNNCCIRNKQGQNTAEATQNTLTINDAQIPLRSNQIIQANVSINSEEEWDIIRGKYKCSNKSTKMSSYESRKDIFKKKEIKYPKGGFYLKVRIDTLAINKKYSEEFGTFLKPRLEISIDKNKNTFYPIENEIDNNPEDSIYKELTINNLPNTNQNEKRNSRDSFNLPIEKYFQINEEFEHFYDEKQIFSLFQLKLINDCLHPESNSSGIEMGKFIIPLNLIYSESNQFFDGYLPIKYEITQEIAYLKAKIEFSERSLKGISLSSFLQDDSTELSFTEPNSLRNIDNLMIPYYYLDPVILDSFFFNERTRSNKDAQMFFALEFVNEKEIDEEKLMKYFSISIQQENYILIYEIFNKLSTMFEQNEFEIICKFYDKLHSEIYQDFIKISDFTNYNPYITKHFLYFILFLNKKKKKEFKNKMHSQIHYQNIIQIIYSIIKNFSETIKTTSYLNSLIEMKECIHISLNIFNEFLIAPSSPCSDIKICTEIYNNAITISSYRIILFRLIDQFINESEIQSSLFELFKKMTQIITKFDNKFIDNTKIHGFPKEISKQFKLLMIEKYDSLFFNSLIQVLEKYQHYYKLHYNILLIILNIIEDPDTQILKHAVAKLGIKNFTDNFHIYRSRSKEFNKLINLAHLNVLYLFSEIKISGNPSYNLLNLVDIFEDIKSYYDDSPENNKVFKEFKSIKVSDPEIHYFLTKIFANLTETKELSDLFIKEERIIEDFLYFIEDDENINNVQSRYKNINKDNDIDDNISIKILENTMEGIRNLLVNGNDKFLITFLKFIDNKYGYRKNFIKVFETCKLNLCTKPNKRLDSLYEEIKIMKYFI